MTRGLFITGTDTGVGKTLVTAGILVWMRRNGVDCVPMKPVQTGAERRSGRPIAPDLEYCLDAAGLQAGDHERNLMAPYLFEPACSPHLAGRLAGHYPTISAIQASFGDLLKEHEAVVVEGAGGVLVPINERETMLDLMCALNLPVVLVSRVGLGAINHALLSLAVLRSAGLDIAGVVFNRTQPSSPEDAFIEEDNPRAISDFGRTAFLGSLPYGGSRAASHELLRDFEKYVPGLAKLKQMMESQ